MRLIDADELLKRVDEERQCLLARGQAGAEHILVHNFRDLIDNAPTVEPQKIVTISPELIEKLASCVVDIVGNIDWEKAIEAYKARPQDEIIKELWNCRNELCLKCERYKEAYRGACEDCRYNFANMERWKEDSDEVADDKHL